MGLYRSNLGGGRRLGGGRLYGRVGDISGDGSSAMDGDEADDVTEEGYRDGYRSDTASLDLPSRSELPPSQEVRARASNAST